MLKYYCIGAGLGSPYLVGIDPSQNRTSYVIGTLPFDLTEPQLEVRAAWSLVLGAKLMHERLQRFKSHGDMIEVRSRTAIHFHLHRRLISSICTSSNQSPPVSRNRCVAVECLPGYYFAIATFRLSSSSQSLSCLLQLQSNQLATVTTMPWIVRHGATYYRLIYHSPGSGLRVHTSLSALIFQMMAS